MKKEAKAKKMTIDTLAIMVAKGFDGVDKKFENLETKMATKNDLLKLELKLTTEIHDFRMDFKSFKKDSNDSMNKHTVDIDDLNDSLLLQDKRIEKLETK